MQTAHGIDQVWLFGSYARGESEISSDIDVLFISETNCTELVERMLSEMGILQEKIDLSHYTRDGIRTLASKGALFTWHLKEEGKPLYQASSWLNELLGEMPKYNNHISDLAVLMQLINDAGESLRDSGSTAIFDAGVISTAIRNTSIILTNYLGATDFSPYAPQVLAQLEPSLEIPIPLSDYKKLLKCRHVSERGISVERLDVDVRELRKNIPKITRWQSKCVEYIQRHGVNDVH